MVNPRTTQSMGLPTKSQKLPTILNQALIKTAKKVVKIGTWNIKRGIIRRDIEIKDLLTTQDLDVLFLTETDIAIPSENDLKIQGFQTIFHLREKVTDHVRLIALVKESLAPQIQVNKSLMSDSFPSIWLNVREENNCSTKIAGFYREWSHNGIRSEDNQISQIKKFTE
jgi:hypothetical protein